MEITDTKYGLKETIIVRIQEVLGHYPEVEKAILYGSRAKGNFKPASDIDLALAGEKLNLTIRHKIEWELDDLLLPYKMDISIINQISNPDLLDHIQRVGIIFYQKHLLTA